jgi:hypothetical protein
VKEALTLHYHTFQCVGAQLVKFLVVKLIHPGSNFRFGISVALMANYSFSGGDVPVDSEALLVTDFVNLKIKLGQSFGCAHKGRVCVCS